MTRVFLILILIGAAVALSGNYSRTGRDATRMLARMELLYDLPRLGSVRDDVVEGLRTPVGWTLAGTQLGMLLGALVIMLLPEDSAGAIPLAIAIVWVLGQVGRLLGSARRMRAGTAPARAWRDVVPAWLVVAVAVSLLVALGFVGVAVGVGGSHVVLAGVFGVLVAALAGVVAGLVGKALKAGSFTVVDVPVPMTEVFRGEVLRTGLTSLGGLGSLGTLAATSVGLDLLTPGQASTMGHVVFAALGLVLFVVVLLTGWAATSWHGKRIAAEYGRD